MKTFISQIIASATVKDSSVIFLGNVVSSILGILFAIFAARLLGPSDWGVVAAVGNMVPILIAIADLGLGAALFQHASGKWNSESTKKFYLSIFSLRLITVFSLAVLLIIVAPFLSQLIYARQDSFLVLITALGFLFVSLLDFQIFSIESKQKWVTAAYFIAATNIFRVAGLYLLFLMNQTTLANVLIVFAISSVVPLIASFLVLPLGIRIKEFGEIFEKFAGFSAWMGGNKIVSTIASRIDVLLLLQLAGAYEAGIYGAASRLAMGVPLILGSFATVLASRFATISDKKQVKSFYYKSFGLSLLIVFGIIVGIIVTPFVTSLFGPEYARTSSVLQWLFVAMIPFALSTPSVNILIYYFKKPRAITFLSIVQLLVMLVVNFYFINSLNIFAPVLAIGISNIITFLVTSFLVWRYLR